MVDVSACGTFVVVAVGAPPFEHVPLDRDGRPVPDPLDGSPADA
jgi:hypothetical protein